MSDADPDAIRREFAELTGVFEDAALLASAGQGIQSLNGGRHQFRRISTTVERVRKRLIILERRLG